VIFVTVGTTMPFDELFQEVDRLVASGALTDEVVCQIGQSAYEPKHCAFFKFKPSIQAEMEAADMLFVHGGTGSTLGALELKKPFVAFVNPRSAGDHQAEFLQELEREFQIVWSREVTDMLALYEKSRRDFHPVDVGKTKIADTLFALLRS